MDGQFSFLLSSLMVLHQDSAIWFTLILKKSAFNKQARHKVLYRVTEERKAEQNKRGRKSFGCSRTTFELCGCWTIFYFYFFRGDWTGFFQRGQTCVFCYLASDHLNQELSVHLIFKDSTLTLKWNLCSDDKPWQKLTLKRKKPPPCEKLWNKNKTADKLPICDNERENNWMPSLPSLPLFSLFQADSLRAMEGIRQKWSELVAYCLYIF